jgi:hypothetical protein
MAVYTSPAGGSVLSPMCERVRKPASTGPRRPGSLADAPHDLPSVAIKRTGDVMRCSPRLDVLQAPLAGKCPGDFRLPDAVEISLDPRDLGHCVMPLKLALWRALAAVTIGFDCQSPPPRLRPPNDLPRTRDDPIPENPETKLRFSGVISSRTGTHRMPSWAPGRAAYGA